MRALFAELRQALRALRSQPLTSAAAILVIALGVGVNTAVFAVAYGVLLRPFPYPEVSRLAVFSTLTPDGTDFAIPSKEIAEWSARLRVVEDLAGFHVTEAPLVAASEPRLARLGMVTEGFFEVLGVRAREGDTRRLIEGSNAVVLSAGLADRMRGSSDERLVGSFVTLKQRRHEVVAVMPESFAFPSDQVDLWTLVEHTSTSKARAVARLATGVSLAQARDDVARVLLEIRGSAVEPAVTSVEEALVGRTRPILAASLAGSALVLLVTCGNVAMLLLGRSVLRRHDSAVRLALGAGGGRLVRAALSESLLLALLGTALGTLLASLGLTFLRRAASGAIPRLAEVTLDGPVLAANAVMVTLVTLLCGLAPAVHAASRDAARELRTRGTSEPRAKRAMSVLVVAQIAASVVLLAGALLMAQTVRRLLAEDTGATPTNALVAEVALGDGSAEGAAAAAPFVAEARARLEALPGIETVGFGSSLPPAAKPFQIFVRWITDTRDEGMSISVVSATPGFLDALGVKLQGGRTFQESDARFGSSVILLSETAARLYSPEESLVERPLPVQLPPFAQFDGPPRVIGVVGDIKYAGLEMPPAAALYIPWSARPAGKAYLIARTSGDPATLLPAVRRTLAEIDPRVPISSLTTFEEVMKRSIAGPRLRLLPAFGFAGVALAVALTGIFALLARAAAEKRKEFAIRLALGATAPGIQRLMLGQALALVGAGAGVGILVTLSLASGLEKFLFGIAPHDPATLAAVTVAVLATSLLAAYLPALRASRVEPAELLRSE